MCRIIGAADLATAVKSAIATIDSQPVVTGFVARSAASAPLAVSARSDSARQRMLVRGHLVVGPASPQH